MDQTTLIASASMFVIVMLASASPQVRVPIGLLLSILVLGERHHDLRIAVLVGAAAVMAARAWSAYAARSGRESDGMRHRQEQLNRLLAASRHYGRTTFLAGAVPLVPPSYVFPVLGAMRLPLRFALAGCFVGQIVLLAITTGLFDALAQWGANGSQADAARLAAVAAVLLVVLGLLRSIDGAATRRDGRLRWREEPGAGRARFFGAGPGMGSAWGAAAHSGSDPHGRARHDDGDEIEAEVVGEEIVDDDEDDDHGDRPQLPGSRT
jgi:hypothetical protein